MQHPGEDHGNEGGERVKESQNSVDVIHESPLIRLDERADGFSDNCSEEKRREGKEIPSDQFPLRLQYSAHSPVRSDLRATLKSRWLSRRRRPHLILPLPSLFTQHGEFEPHLGVRTE